MKESLILCIALGLFSTSVYGVETSESILNEAPQPVSKDGKYVSPENEVSDPKEVEPEEPKKPDPIAVKPPKDKVPASLLRLGRGDYFSQFAFVLDKQRRTLSVWKYGQKGLELVEAHPADMGRRSGDKMILGDRKTPEGIYFFRRIYEGKNLNFDEYGSRAYTMDYPNLFDQRNKKTGSGIWLHAVPNRKSLYRGSRGCVVVRDKVIKPLGEYIELGKTPIIVHEKVEYISNDAYQARQTKMLGWLETWRQSWESKNIDDYIAFYSENFESLNMNKEQWKAYKNSLNKQYEYIRVQVAKPSIFVYEDEMVIRFLQGYDSNVNSDFGEKVLFAKKDSSGDFKIVAERWSALPQKLIALLGKKQVGTSEQQF